MSNNPRFWIPERVSSLMTPDRHQRLRQYQERSVSAASRISKISHNSLESTASDFLEAKISELEDEKGYLLCWREGLDEAKEAGSLTTAAFHEEIQPFLTRFKRTVSTINVLKRQKKVLAEDLEEQIALKKQRVQDPPDEALLERAYRDTIIPRVMSASAKRPASAFDQSAFKVAVRRYYGIDTQCSKRMSYCHVLGEILPATLVKVAHLVPKSLTQDEVSHLFGGEHAVATDPRNGRCLPFTS